MKYTLRQLEVFLAAANEQNISRAAESLAMSQSAASAALKELELHFDIKLFDRIGKRLKLNDFGRALRSQAEAILSQAQELEQEFSQQNRVGSLKIGATLTIGSYMAVGMIADYLKLYPGSEVALEIANTHDIAQRVINFEIDIGLVEGELQNSELLVNYWRDDELVVFCGPGHFLAKRKTLVNKDLLKAQWVLREKGSGTRQAFDRAMQGILPDLNVLLELQQTEAIKRAVESNLGISCLSKITLEEAFSRGSLIPLKVKQRDFSRNFYYILRKDKYRSTSIERWLQLCDQVG